MRRKCAKQCCLFPRAHQEVQTACDLSTYGTCFSVGNLADFLSALTAFVNMVLAGLCPREAARFFCLVADSWHLRKKQAGSASSPLVSPCVAWLQSAPVLVVQVGYLHTSARGSLVWAFWRMRSGHSFCPTLFGDATTCPCLCEARFY